MENGSTYEAFIKPSPKSWTDWNVESEAIHNIPRKLLNDIGKDPAVVAQELNDFIGAGTVICDGGRYGLQWANELYYVAEINRTWTLVHFTEALESWHIANAMRGISYQAFDNAYQELQLKEHDALNDAKMIHHALTHIKANF